MASALINLIKDQGRKIQDSMMVNLINQDLETRGFMYWFYIL